MISRPEIRYIVTSVNEITGVPSQPDSSRRKFMSISRAVARNRVSINLSTWKQLPRSASDDLKNEILTHFVIRPEDRKGLERAPLLVANKSWRHWKNKLVRQYVHKQTTPFDKYPKISQEEWAEFAAHAF